MIDPKCLGPDIDRSKISPDAEIRGASYLTGSRTAVAAGAVVIDSRLHDTVVESGARVVDSICVAHGKAHSHRCDAAGRVVVSGCVPAVVFEVAEITGATLSNTSVGARSVVEETSATDCTIGPDNSVRRAKMVLTETLSQVTILGPTELSESRIGHGATIDRRGYFEGDFSNSFPQLQFDEKERRLKVAGTIDLPHVSRYGTNTINSTNSGKLLPQPDGILKELGPNGGLWSDPLLSHEQIRLGPCCWVAPWTKVVGQSAEPYADDESMVNDRLMTYLMPFSIAGIGGELTRGLVMPGELSLGFGPKQRRGAWMFTYAPGAVVAMVARLHAALPDGEKHVADTIVVEALKTAVEMTRAMASEYNVDLALPVDEQPKAGWPRWVASTHSLLHAHLDNDLWRFEGGRPCEWHEQSGQWRHPRFDAILALAPDALECQIDETAILACDDPVESLFPALPNSCFKDRLKSSTQSQIDPKARVAADATIGPGCLIGPGAVIDAGATLWRSAVDDCHIASGSVVERCEILGSQIGSESTVRSSHIVGSQLGANSSTDSAWIESSRLADRATVSAFVSLKNVETQFGAILGSRCETAKIGTNFMAMHLAGEIGHVEALPTVVVVDKERIAVPAIPMIGGGAILRGTVDAPVRVECSFIGSNAVIEAGTRIGFGCFVLGRLPAGSGLLPLTISTDENPQHHQIGGVLASMPSTIITHFLGWAFQAVGPEKAPAVSELVRQSIRRGIEVVEDELKKRQADGATTGGTPGPRSRQDDCQSYASLADYTEKQLEAGLANYRRSLDSGAWDMVYRDGRLWFAAEKGQWHERSGSALWRQAATS